MSSINNEFTHNKHHTNKKILIIDDDRFLADSIKYIIESKSKFKCEIVTDPYEAFDKLSYYEYELLFIDQKMQGIDGHEILEQLDEMVALDPSYLKTKGFEKGVPVVMISGKNLEKKKQNKFKNFELFEVLQKKNLLNFLSVNFA